MVFKAVLFDLDGTLLDTIDDITEAINSILGELGFPTHSVEDYKRYVGAGVLHLMQRVLPEGNQDSETIGKFLELEAKMRRIGHTKPYDGIETLLDELSSRGIKLAILSNRPEKSTRILVDRLLKGWNFEVVMGAGDSFPLKPDRSAALKIAELMKVNPEEILYLGDSDVDMMTAAGAGMYPIGVTWGFRSAEELKKNGARSLIAKPMELLNILSATP